MILNKSDFEVAVLQRGHRMPIFHKLVWFFRVILKWSRWACKRTQRLISVHISLYADKLCSPRPSLLWKSPSFRKQSGVKSFVQPDLFSESEVTCDQVWWPILRICALDLTHPSAHTHTVNTHPEQWAAFHAAAPREQLGVRCLAQGSHLSYGIEGGESAGYSLHNQNDLIIETV